MGLGDTSIYLHEKSEKKAKTEKTAFPRRVHAQTASHLHKTGAARRLQKCSSDTTSAVHAFARNTTRKSTSTSDLSWVATAVSSTVPTIHVTRVRRIYTSSTTSILFSARELRCTRIALARGHVFDPGQRLLAGGKKKKSDARRKPARLIVPFNKGRCYNSGITASRRTSEHTSRAHVPPKKPSLQEGTTHDSSRIIMY